MQNLNKIVIAIAIAATMAGGCARHQASATGPKEAVGTILGAVAGGYAGSEIGGDGDSGKIGTAVGTVVGGLVGNAFGRHLDQSDRRAHRRTRQAALSRAPTGHSFSWRANSGNAGGSVTPTSRKFGSPSGQVCREYRTTIVVNGKTETARGTACRRNGKWVIQ